MQLKVNGLSFTIDGIRLLNNIGIDIQKGEFVGLVGPNGCGKSTLLKNIYRVYRPQSSTVFIDGTDVLTLTSKKLATRMAVMAQENVVEFDFKVREMVMFGRYSHRKFLQGDSAADRDLCTLCLERVGLTGYEDRSFQSLSGGEKQRVLLARVLMQESPLILLDEPTNHLDVSHQYHIMDVLRKLDVTVFSSIHDLNLAALYCDRILMMYKGEIVDNGTPEEVITEENLKNYFGVKAQITTNSVTNKPQIYYLPE